MPGCGGGRRRPSNAGKISRASYLFGGCASSVAMDRDRASPPFCVVTERGMSIDLPWNDLDAESWTFCHGDVETWRRGSPGSATVESSMQPRSPAADRRG